MSGLIISYVPFQSVNTVKGFVKNSNDCTIFHDVLYNDLYFD